jgi:hypothetical protein
MGDGWTEAGSQIVFEDERDIQDRIDSMNVEFAVIKNGGSVCVLHECKEGHEGHTDRRLLARAAASTRTYGWTRVSSR